LGSFEGVGIFEKAASRGEEKSLNIKENKKEERLSGIKKKTSRGRGGLQATTMVARTSESAQGGPLQSLGGRKKKSTENTSKRKKGLTSQALRGQKIPPDWELSYTIKPKDRRTKEVEAARSRERR